MHPATILVQLLFIAPHITGHCAPSRLRVPFITLEEHFLSQAHASYPPFQPLYATVPAPVNQKLLSLADERLQDMNAGQVTMQVISHTAPSNAAPDVCEAANNQLAAAVQNNPQRFAGFATLPMNQPSAAVAELRRSVQELGFVGAMVDNHVNGQFYDNSSFWPVFAAAQDLDVPIYLHPTFPTPQMTAVDYAGNYSRAVTAALGTYSWGWHADTGLHILRLFASGFFDQFPRIKIIIGHMGEMLPFQLDRVIRSSAVYGNRTRGLNQVWDENIWVTTSGMFTLPPFQCLLGVTRVDHVMYSVDYPFSSTVEGLQFMQEVRRSKLLSREEFEMVAYKNAESLLRISVN